MFMKCFIGCVLALSLFCTLIDGLSYQNGLSRQKRATFYIDQVAAKVGCIITRAYNVKGTVWVIHNSTQLYIEHFNFDGSEAGVKFDFNIGMCTINDAKIKHLNGEKVIHNTFLFLFY